MNFAVIIHPLTLRQNPFFYSRITQKAQIRQNKKTQEEARGRKRTQGERKKTQGNAFGEKSHQERLTPAVHGVPPFFFENFSIISQKVTGEKISSLGWSRKRLRIILFSIWKRIWSKFRRFFSGRPFSVPRAPRATR